jgi:hypothetical protein
MLMQPFLAFANRVAPPEHGVDNPLFQRGYPGFFKDCHLEGLRLGVSWTALVVVGAIFAAVVAVIYNLITGHVSFIVTMVTFAPCMFCAAGMCLQILRSFAAGVLAQSQTAASGDYRPPRLVQWMLTTHDSDLVVQFVATVGAVTLYIVHGGTGGAPMALGL